MNAFVVLIGGGAAAGKSTLAFEIAHILGIKNIVSTDALREVLRALRPDDPIIRAETWEAGGLLNPRRADLYEGLLAQANALEPLIEPMVQHFLSKGMPSILEGIHILPTDAIRRLAKAPGVVVFFLDCSHSRIRENYLRRRHTTHMRAETEGFKAVAARVALHRDIIRRAHASGLDIIRNDAWPRPVRRAVRLILQRVRP